MSLNTPPEGVETATAEAPHVSTALASCAQELGVEASSLHWTLDKSHFRSEQGLVLAQDTVRIIAWKRDEKELAACNAGKEWLTEVIAGMDLTGTVTEKMTSSDKVVLGVDVDNAARFIGRKGSTLQGVSDLLAETMGEQFPGINFHISVADKRSDSEDRGRGRGRDRDRDDRGSRTSEKDEAALKRMAQKIAERVLESGESEQIRRTLNSYNRRIVHMTVKEIEGVGSRSLGDGQDKTIELFREA
ncbi:MAG: R3H domain-containing nucleic acid-binding protein [Myxococcota bacterium]|nr:R3H domain-containing nucleic acid-binding protein [Myxococcota bacterium]